MPRAYFCFQFYGRYTIYYVLQKFQDEGMRYWFLVSFFILSPLLPGQAQALEADDIREIRAKALRHVRQLEGILNLIAQPDEYVRENSINQLIQGYYQPSSDYQIFRDSLVTITDDLNPTTPNNEIKVSIKEYLIQFHSVYEKSPVTSVFFNNYEVSSIREGQRAYVEVYYTNEFINRHVDYATQPYTVSRKKVILEAQPQADTWEVLITEITDLSAEENAAREAATSFSQLERVYRPGKTYPIPIQINADNPPSLLLLYRDEQQVEDLSGLLSDDRLEWKVPKSIARGGGYRFVLRDSLDATRIESSSFIIRRGFP